MKGPKEASLFSCVSSSLCLHGSMVVALAMAPQMSGLLNEGTTLQTIEFSVATPKGQQLETKDTGPLQQRRDIPQNTPKALPVKVVAQKTKPSDEPVGVAKKAPSKAKAAPKKVVTQKESPVAVKEKEDLEKIALAKELEELKKKQKEQEELLAKAKAKQEAEEMARLLEEEKAEEARIAKELEEQRVQEEREEQEQLRLAKLAELENELAAERAESNRLAKEKAEQAAKMAALKNAQNSSNAQSDQAYGVSSGIRAVTDLKQTPGNRPPQYTELARLRKMQGEGELMYYVTQSGQVSQIRLTRSTGYSELDRQAIDAISKYRFYPGQAGWTKHAVIFELKGSARASGGRLRVRR